MCTATAASSNDGVCLAHKAELTSLCPVQNQHWHLVSSVPVSSHEKLGAEFKPAPNQIAVTPKRVLEKKGCYLGFLPYLASPSQPGGIQDPHIPPTRSQPISTTLATPTNLFGTSMFRDTGL